VRTQVHARLSHALPSDPAAAYDNVTAAANNLEARLAGGGLVGDNLGATLSAEVDTHVALLCDLLRPLLDDGYQRLLVLNGHGGNIDTMHMALRRLQPRLTRSLVIARRRDRYFSAAAREFTTVLGEAARGEA